MKKIFVICLSAILIFFGGFFVLNSRIVKNVVIEKDVVLNADTHNTPEAKPENSNVLIYAVGDIMLDRGVKYMIYKYGNGDYRFPFENIADYFKSADIIFGNLEGQISDKGNKIGTVNSFRVEPKAIEGLKYAGFNVLSVANNHSFDYNTAALEDSFNRLKKAGIEYVGGGFNKEEAFKLKIIEKNGTKIGFLAYCSVGAKGWVATDTNTGIAFITEKDMEGIKKDISKAKEQVDVLIVSSHFGDEYQVEQNESQIIMYQAFIDAGADIVLGHHPHVIQPVAEYGNGWIAYSLGNFVFDQGFDEITMKGLLLEISFENKKVKSVLSREIKMNSHFQPELSALP
ncbi:MAG: CapA family protein [Candidatus Nealsonbacteria bacterium]|nr:CapA family protein [Candidatus Nealsonbacteria bacterium]